MSRDFIGSKISIITKSQCRYSGTIIGIDAQTSSIVLGNVKCFGTENRSGHSANGHMTGTVAPIMQFANSDIEDLKIVDEEQVQENSQAQQTRSMPVISSPPIPKQSIHDDPAIVSAVMSSKPKENTSNLSATNRLIHNLQHMNLSDDSSKPLKKNEESRIHSNSGELGAPWSLLSSSTWEHNPNSKSSSFQNPAGNGNKSKFFDDFISDKNNNTNQHQFNRFQQRSSNTHSTQTSRENHGQYDENGLPIRQPFFANDQPYPPKQQNRYQNGHSQYQQRHFYNNRRPQMTYQPRRTGGGNRETFQDNPNDYDADFDFETSNLKFNKLTTEDDLPTNQSLQPQIDLDSSSEHPPIYDKKKSFFDHLVVTEPSDGPTSYKFNRSNNQDTFGNDGYQRYHYRSNGNGYRRSNNNNYRQQQYDHEDFHYRQHQQNRNNGYQYRY